MHPLLLVVLIAVCTVAMAAAETAYALAGAR